MFFGDGDSSSIVGPQNACRVRERYPDPGPPILPLWERFGTFVERYDSASVVSFVVKRPAVRACRLESNKKHGLGARALLLPSSHSSFTLGPPSLTHLRTTTRSSPAHLPVRSPRPLQSLVEVTSVQYHGPFGHRTRRPLRFEALPLQRGFLRQGFRSA